MRLLSWSVLLLGMLSLALWAASFSWMWGVTPPTQWIDADASPWFVAEAAAAVLGATALAAGLVVARSARCRNRSVPLVGLTLGGFAMAMSMASILIPA